MANIDSLFIDLCIFEVLASDNRTVDEARTAYNESLFSSTDTETSSVMLSDSAREILQSILSKSCPGQPACTGRGTCKDSVCICNPGNALILHTNTQLYFTACGTNLHRRKKQPRCAGLLRCLFVLLRAAFAQRCDGISVTQGTI